MGQLGQCGNQTSASQTISVDVNDPPVAVDDTASTDENSPVTITADQLLANDSDLDVDQLTLSSVNNPTDGNVEIDPNGDVYFTPDPDFTGDASFDYTVSDDKGGTAIDTVTVTVNPVTDQDLTVPKNIDKQDKADF